MLAAEQKARSNAEAANRAKDQFLATVSHELRTPLGAILGWARILRNQTSDPQTTARGLEAIERNATAQAQLIEDILDVSRIISGKLRLIPQAIDFISVVRAAVESIKPAVEARRIRLETRLNVPAVSVRGDPNRLQQVIWNLLSNAVKFSPEKGRVQLGRGPGGFSLCGTDCGGRRSRNSASFLPTSLNRFGRQTPRQPASMAGWAWGFPSSSSLWSCTGAPSMP